MTARDDYPTIARAATSSTFIGRSTDHAADASKALDELDRLRGEVSSFLAILHAIDTPLARSAIDAYNEIHAPDD